MRPIRLFGVIAAGALGALGVPAFSAAGGQPGAGSARNGAGDLIPRERLFGNPRRASVRISPDGDRLAYLAPFDGVLNVWVGPVDGPDVARPVTRDRSRGIRQYRWAPDAEHILYLQDRGGDENWRIYSVDLATGEEICLTPQDGVQARIQHVSHTRPQTILISVNDRNPSLHDLHEVHIDTGESEMIQENDAGHLGYLTDDDFNVRQAVTFQPDGSLAILERDDDGSWQQRELIGPEDSMTTTSLGYDHAGDTEYMIDSRDRNTAALFARDIATGARTLLFEHPQADVGGMLSHPTEGVPQAVSVNYRRQEWHVIDDRVREDVKRLRAAADGDFSVTSRSLDDTRWIVAESPDDGPVQYFLYQRPEGALTFLFTNRPELEGAPLASMRDVVIRSRDGLNLVSYLTLPLASDPDGDMKPAEALPMVLLVHGGPWARDEWGYNPLHQWLANRGYAVLSVNFRGSTGFGKGFINAADRQWGAMMHDDLLDAVSWAVEKGIALEDKVAIMGGSYGGYATLWGLAATPEIFACGVDIVGPSNLITLAENIPPYWAPLAPMLTQRMGDWTTEEGREFLLSRSPLQHVDRIQRPLLIGQGANDPRVKQQESDQIVQAMQAKGIPVTYVLYPDEGHGFARPENNLSFFAVAEAFLAEHLGGRYEPVGDDFQGASITVPEGAALVPGLRDALN
jgi:dipeptidyl aminopeptidase/acylaminoacyl peptidase